MTKGKKFYLVQEDILPESIVKAARAKEMLLRGEAGTVGEAVEKACISRSAYYKYRDSVFPLYSGPRERDITINLTLEHRAGVLSKVLSFIASRRGNIITIRQEAPVEGLAKVCINIDISGMSEEIGSALHEIKSCDGVKAVSLEGWNEVG